MADLSVLDNYYQEMFNVEHIREKSPEELRKLDAKLVLPSDERAMKDAIFIGRIQGVFHDIDYYVTKKGYIKVLHYIGD
jgi:hypothetical protein